MKTWLRFGCLLAALLGLAVGCKSTHDAPADAVGYHETAPPPMIDTHAAPGPVLSAPPAGAHGAGPAIAP
jgi:hypothetical protein